MMKKWTLLTLAVLLLTAILFFYVSFNGNFISKMVAKNMVQDYVTEMYKGHNVQLVDSGFNFKDGHYVFHYEIYYNTIRSNYSFSIGGPLLPNKPISGYLDWESADEQLTTAYQKAGVEWLEEQLREQGITFNSVGYEVSIPRGLYPENMSWQPQVDNILLPWISVELTDEQQTEREFLQQAEQIRQLLHEQIVTYTEVRISVMREYDNSDGSREGYAPTYYEGLYSTNFTPNTKDLTIN